MVTIPPDVRVLSTLQTGSVYYFEDHRLSSNEPHYFIVLNKNPRDDTVLFMPCASSKVEKRKQIAAKLGFNEKTLVVISPSEYKCFSVESVVDCNNIFERTTLSVIEKLGNGKLRVCMEIMPQHLVDKMIEGALISNQISEEFKRYIRP